MGTSMIKLHLKDTETQNTDLGHEQRTWQCNRAGEET